MNVPTILRLGTVSLVVFVHTIDPPVPPVFAEFHMRIMRIMFPDDGVGAKSNCPVIPASVNGPIIAVFWDRNVPPTSNV